MTPQSTFMVLAPLADGREDNLHSLLASMNLRPGVVHPRMRWFPFGQFARLHFARFLIVEAPTAGDIAVYGIAPARWPLSLAFLGDGDGPADMFLADLVDRAGADLRRIFCFCRGFSPNGDLLAWKSTSSEVGLLRRQMAETGFLPTMITSGANSSEEYGLIAGQAAEGTLVVADRRFNTAEFSQFEASLRAAYQMDSDLRVTRGYASVKSGRRRS